MKAKIREILVEAEMSHTGYFIRVNGELVGFRSDDTGRIYPISEVDDRSQRWAAQEYANNPKWDGYDESVAIKHSLSGTYVEPHNVGAEVVVYNVTIDGREAETVVFEDAASDIIKDEGYYS